MVLVAVRLIDLAIFASLGVLWIGGAVFIVVLYRWLFRFEREQDPTRPDAVPVVPDAVPVVEDAPPARVSPQTTPAHEAVAAST